MGLAQVVVSQIDHQDADGHVDEKGQPPRQLGECAADDETQHRADAGHRGENRGGCVAGRALGECGGDQRQTGGCGNRGPHTLKQPGDHQSRLIPGDSAQHRGDGEQGHADDEGSLAPDRVAQSTSEQHQTAEGQHVGGDHPTAAGVGQTQFILDLGQRHDGHRGIHGRQLLHTADRSHRGNEATRGQPGREIAARACQDAPLGFSLIRGVQARRNRARSGGVPITVGAAQGRAVSIVEGRHSGLPYINIKRTLKSRRRPPARSR